MRQVMWHELSSSAQQQVLQRSATVADVAVSQAVAAIISRVRNEGDRALFDYTWQFDGAKLESLEVSVAEYAATSSLTRVEQHAILTAQANIHDYHQRSSPQPFEYQRDGLTLGKLLRPIDRVGLYIPGGSAPLVSTLLMLAIPAAVAGCPTKVLVTPPRRDGSIAPAILFAAQACGIERVYKVGGAQAIAALALGTESLPRVHKIFGPGNKYVTAAKLQVAQIPGGAALDMPAGPSEVCVIAAAVANPIFVASDLLAQAEHDVAAQVILVTTSSHLASAVQVEVQRQLGYLSRRAIIEQALSHSTIIVATDLEQCFAIANDYAPEHLILHLENAADYLAQVTNAGSVFLGPWTPEAVGDYASGSNHVLPTYGYAKMYSGLDVSAFMKTISYQQLSRSGLAHLAPTVATLADLEGLDAHKNALMVRLEF